MARCECRCGYRCGGPGHCKLDLFECLAKDDGQHFVKDCGHDFTGPWVELESINGGTKTCKHCGVSAIGHDMLVGP